MLLLLKMMIGALEKEALETRRKWQWQGSRS